MLRPLQQRWSFPASDVGCAKEGPGHRHSPGHPTASKVSTGCHFVLWLWIGFMVTGHFATRESRHPGGGGTPYNGLYGEAPPERGTFFRLQLYKGVGISQVEVYKRIGKSVI